MTCTQQDLSETGCTTITIMNFYEVVKVIQREVSYIEGAKVPMGQSLSDTRDPARTKKTFFSPYYEDGRHLYN